MKIFDSYFRKKELDKHAKKSYCNAWHVLESHVQWREFWEQSFDPQLQYHICHMVPKDKNIYKKILIHMTDIFNSSSMNENISTFHYSWLTNNPPYLYDKNVDHDIINTYTFLYNEHRKYNLFSKFPSLLEDQKDTTTSIYEYVRPEHIKKTPKEWCEFVCHSHGSHRLASFEYALMHMDKKYIPFFLFRCSQTSAGYSYRVENEQCIERAKTMLNVQDSHYTWYLILYAGLIRFEDYTIDSSPHSFIHQYNWIDGNIKKAIDAQYPHEKYPTLTKFTNDYQNLISALENKNIDNILKSNLLQLDVFQQLRLHVHFQECPENWVDWIENNILDPNCKINELPIHDLNLAQDF